eukprot:TRINITY_DN1706_c0_g1_i6.p1 TRINITY_DN1706_c0_g1~~TRINITY_DN1706_c0_g1_i6.p1  ORF type:complete len:182 (-),score=31.47 TRINITY_DN1706_c0_g1_i6:161-643(-)
MEAPKSAAPRVVVLPHRLGCCCRQQGSPTTTTSSQPLLYWSGDHTLKLMRLQKPGNVVPPRPTATPRWHSCLQQQQQQQQQTATATATTTTATTTVLHATHVHSYGRLPADSANHGRPSSRPGADWWHADQRCGCGHVLRSKLPDARNASQHRGTAVASA